MQLIDVDKLWKAITTRIEECCDLVDLIKIIETQATEEAVPVRYGKWVKISPANIFECSKCGKNVMTNDISVYNFCHGCGADMRGDGNAID